MKHHLQRPFGRTLDELAALAMLSLVALWAGVQLLPNLAASELFLPALVSTFLLVERARSRRPGRRPRCSR